jgi:hypothetical protein
MGEMFDRRESELGLRNAEAIETKREHTIDGRTMNALELQVDDIDIVAMHINARRLIGKSVGQATLRIAAPLLGS